MIRRLAPLFALVCILALLTPASARATESAEAWLLIDVANRELRVAEGTAIEVRGRGSLHFRQGRRVIGFDKNVRVQVDGDMVTTTSTVRPGAEVLLIGGETQWHLRQAFTLPRRDGTSITDTDPGATAAIDVANETHFFLHVAEGGVTTFFHPSETSVPVRLSFPSPERQARQADLRASLDTFFERLTPFGFSGSVLLAEGEDLVFANAYGLADRDDGRRFQPSTVVTIASITKSFTAAAVLKLQELGRLDVHDLISDHLDGVPADKRGITIHQLLTHTSGLKRNGLEGGDTNREATRDSVLQNVLQSELVSEPGATYRYSNVGYTLLAMIVENVSGMDYETFLHEYLLAPAGMYRTGYLLPRYQDSELAAGFRGDRRIDPVIRLPMLDDGPTWNVRGNGALHSDSYDMYRWVLALRSYALLSPESMRAMTTPHVDQGDGEHFYGYGLEIGTTSAGTRTLSHRGGNGYFATDLHWLPDEDALFFIGSNAGALNMTRLADQVQAIYLGDPYLLPPLLADLPAQVLRQHVGKYRLPTGGTITVTASDSSLALQTEGDDAIQAVLGGARTRDDAAVNTLADHSRDLVRAEFRGDFQPKFEAMGGTTSIADLERYHGYDRAVWDEQFGELRDVEVVAVAAELDETQVIVRIVFDRGAAAQLHTWRDGRLANISVIPDWREFLFSRTVYPVSETAFESFSPSSSVRLVIEIEEPAPTSTHPRYILFSRRSATRAERIESTR